MRHRGVTMLRTRSAATGAWLAVITGVVLAQSPAAPPGARQTLGAGSTSESGLQRGERHVYRVPLEAGQFLYLTAQQRALDVGLRLLAPDGALLMSADTMNGSYGIERIALVAPAAGDYSLEVSTGSDRPAGRYALTVVELRAATPEDTGMPRRRRPTPTPKRCGSRTRRTRGPRPSQSIARLPRPFSRWVSATRRRWRCTRPGFYS